MIAKIFDKFCLIIVHWQERMQERMLLSYDKAKLIENFGYHCQYMYVYPRNRCTFLINIYPPYIQYVLSKAGVMEESVNRELNITRS